MDTASATEQGADTSESFACTVVLAATGIFLSLDSNDGAKVAWARRYKQAEALREQNALPGFDPNWMKLLPMSVPAKWEDAGPHISVVSAPPGGTRTRDANKKPDDLAAAKEQAQCSIAGQTFQISTEGIVIKYLLLSLIHI